MVLVNMLWKLLIIDIALIYLGILLCSDIWTKDGSDNIQNFKKYQNIVI